jgi:hypothetical protein
LTPLPNHFKDDRCIRCAGKQGSDSSVQQTIYNGPVDFSKVIPFLQTCVRGCRIRLYMLDHGDAGIKTKENAMVVPGFRRPFPLVCPEQRDGRRRVGAFSLKWTVEFSSMNRPID